MVRDILILSMLLLLVANPVLAGESYDVSFEDMNINAVLLFEGDEVRFDLMGGTHSLIIEETSSTDTVKFDIIPFLSNGSTKVYPGIVTLDTIMKVDLDRDHVNDINVALYSVSDSGEVHIVIQDETANQEEGIEVEEEITGDVTEPGLVGGDDSTSSTKWVYYLIGALILVGAAYMVFRGDEEKPEDSTGEKSEDLEEEKTEEAKEELREVEAEPEPHPLDEEDSKEEDSEPETEAKQTEEGKKESKETEEPGEAKKEKAEDKDKREKDSEKA